MWYYCYYWKTEGQVAEFLSMRFQTAKTKTAAAKTKRLAYTSMVVSVAPRLENQKVNGGVI